MKRILKTLIIFVILLILGLTYINVFAVTPDSDFKKQGKDWLALAKQEKQTDLGDWTGFNDLAGILWGSGIFIVLVCGVILGIKYMFSSVEEKASIKESIRPYIIGAAIILGALSIWKFLVEFLDRI